MPRIAIVLVFAALSGCGVETAGTAATSAAIKQKELEAGKKTMEQMQQQVEASRQQVEEAHRRAEKDSER